MNHNQEQLVIDKFDEMFGQLEQLEQRFLNAKTQASMDYYERKGKALMAKIHAFAEKNGLPCPFENCPANLYH